MKRYQFIAFRMLVLYAFLAVALASCSNDDDENHSGQVVLEAFGPSPALRGSDLTFIGSNMDRVSSVIFPGNIEVSAINVVNSGEITVAIPQDAAEGYVSLKFADGEITTKTLLDYTEPISISKISPHSLKAGEKLTIEGDYLNLIQRVVFADNVVVKSSDFTSWKRAEIELTVPREARTGTILLTDTAQIPVSIVSKDTLVLSLPSVPSVVSFEGKRPLDILALEGQNLDLVKSVVVPDNDTIDFAVDGTNLSFQLPETAKDGTIKMIAYSGVVVSLAQLTMLVPSNLTVSPADGLRGGDLITVSGDNMDLVTTAIFPGVEDGVIPESVAADQITLRMPDRATSGDLILQTGSGKSVSAAVATQKPEVTAYDPSPVAAGNMLTITGTNLDLVQTVTFQKGQLVEVSPSSSTSLSVKVPNEAETGSVILTMANGETVNASSLTINQPEFCYIPVLPDNEIDAGTLMAVDIKNEDKLTGVQVDGSSTQYILHGSRLYILIPDDAAGTTQLNLISSNGSVGYTVPVVGSGIVETVIMDTVHDLGSWASEEDGGAFRLYKSSFEDVAAGSTLRFYFTVTGAGQLQLNDAGWGQIGDVLNFSDESQTSYDVELTSDMLNHILTTSDGWSETAIVIQGTAMIISKVSVITSGASPSETP